MEVWSYSHWSRFDFVDLHGWNIAFSLPDLKGQSDAVLIEYLNPHAASSGQ